MFKIRYLFVVCSIILLTDAAPLDKDSEATIVNNDYTIDKKGNYRFSFKTSNGISREETGAIINTGQSNEFIAVRGRYSYIDEDGKQIIVEYTANENGYNILKPTPEDIIPFPAAPLPGNVVASLLGK
ncbi:endocuticle structural glycoprotein SgAbd-5-like [Bicyclus anynana]|uniref:Endocuticle structural glycoprotein SgAbd-5-like n=1 Tax=Bicyclus anynana TaxID=110368 RepID=A0A6J1P9J4_BICAN|nr:endocuticle structural glycoprotein SgAbd-5-like [Bicyclus anynana]